MLFCDRSRNVYGEQLVWSYRGSLQDMRGNTMMPYYGTVTLVVYLPSDRVICFSLVAEFHSGRAVTLFGFRRTCDLPHRGWTTLKAGTGRRRWVARRPPRRWPARRCRWTRRGGARAAPTGLGDELAGTAASEETPSLKHVPRHKIIKKLSKLFL